jgi:hypothetical protein
MAARCGELACLRQTRGGRFGTPVPHSSYSATRDVTIARPSQPLTTPDLNDTTSITSGIRSNALRRPAGQAATPGQHVITITGSHDHLRPDLMISFTGMRSQA